MVASIDYIERIIGYFERAAEANLAAPGRAGNMVELTPELADEVVITGDLHGHRRNFNLIKRTAALEANPRRHLILQEVCHGGPTYPENGGCMSHTVLEDVARLKTEYPDRVHFILGNHELAELADYPIQKNRQMLNLLFRLGLQQMYGPATDRVRDAMLPFLRSCPLAVRVPRGVFVSHSIPERCDERPFETSLFTRELEDVDFVERTGIFDLVWGRDYREENAQAFANQVGARILINGHEPCPQGFNAPNSIQVIVDCCNAAASYLLLPTDRELTHAEILARVQRLG
ncbi:MAG: metallophosphoesterase [Patescibacteria group bacterium]|nr:metallophosphoesterase [Patescibacteria group bacterium]